MRRIAFALVIVSLAWAGGAPHPLQNPPYEVNVFADLIYYDGPDAHPVKHRLDLFMPEDLVDVPVLLFVHGGSWSSGDKSAYSFVGRTFASQGFATVVINYRLSPAVQHPAHIEDVARAFAWVYKNIARYGGNPEKIFIAGHSAGGHLVALLALDEKYLQAHALLPRTIKGAIPLSGVYDVTVIPPGTNYDAVFGTDPQVRLDASPMTHISSNEPPFLVVYAQFEYPTLDAQARQFSERLMLNGNEVQLLEIPGRDHIGLAASIGTLADLTTEAILAFIRTQLAGPLTSATQVNSD
jgi:acetyl esterase/lipase